MVRVTRSRRSWASHSRTIPVVSATPSLPPITRPLRRQSQISPVLLEPTSPEAVSTVFPVNLLSPGLPGKHMSRPKHFFTFCLFLISERFHLVTRAGLELVTLLLLQPLGYSGKLALPGRILTFCTFSLSVSVSLLRFKCNFCVNVLPACISGPMCLPDGCQERALDPLGLKLQTAVSQYMDAGT